MTESTCTLCGDTIRKYDEWAAVPTPGQKDDNQPLLIVHLDCVDEFAKAYAKAVKTERVA